VIELATGLALRLLRREVHAVSKIVPRWEWRTFGETFGAADSAFSELSPDAVQDSDETYLLSPSSSAAVKLRGGLMDVKQLLEVNDDGLQQWLPVMKAEFPLSAADVAAVLDSFALAAPSPLTRTSYTWPEVLDEIAGTEPGLLAVDVHKTRRRYTIDGCMAELTDVRTEHATTRTLAIESTDPAQVSATVRELRMPTQANVSFAAGLKAMVGLGAERYAVIDVGTNSVKFHIGERAPDNAWRTIVDRAAVTRLGEGLEDTGQLSPEPIRRTSEAIVQMIEEARAQHVTAIAAVGTAGLRIAPNSVDLINAVRARTGVTVEVISGEDEARLACLGATAGIGGAEGTRVVFDTGGGSSQLTFGTGDHVDERFSVNVGAVRYTERYGLDRAVSQHVLDEALAAIAADLVRLDGRPAPDHLIGMGGTVTNLTAVKHGLEKYDPDIVQGSVLDQAEIDRQIELYRLRDAVDRRAIVGLQPQRADLILAGACVVRTLLGKLGRDSFVVSDRGLRHGVLIERFGHRREETADE
jgi:exopolyphosphatase / guanosine-5'-triphosphate,3'-diphosphate pyrophosphatase